MALPLDLKGIPIPLNSRYGSFLICVRQRIFKKKTTLYTQSIICHSLFQSCGVYELNMAHSSLSAVSFSHTTILHR